MITARSRQPARSRLGPFAVTLCLALAGACVPVDTGPQRKAWDVRGNYDLTWADDIKLRLDLGGAVRERTAQGWAGVIDFGTWNGEPVTLDLGAFCARPDVACPSEVYWHKIAIDQADLHKKQSVYGLTVWDRRGAAAGGSGRKLGGLLDHAKADAFLVGLGAQAGSAGAGSAGCAALALSVAEGRFTRAADPAPKAGEAAEVAGIADGRVKFGWLGGCAFGPLLVAATLTAETSYTGTRVGDFDLPADLPKAGTPTGG